MVRESVGTLADQQGQGDAQRLAVEAADGTQQCEPLTWRRRIGAALSAVVPPFRCLARGRPPSRSLWRARGPRCWFRRHLDGGGGAHLATIAVRRTTVAAAWVSCCSLARWTWRLRASTVFLEARVSNVAQRMYDKYGFVLSRIRKAYYSDNGEDALKWPWRGIGQAPVSVPAAEAEEDAGRKDGRTLVAGRTGTGS